MTNELYYEPCPCGGTDVAIFRTFEDVVIVDAEDAHLYVDGDVPDDLEDGSCLPVLTMYHAVCHSCHEKLQRRPQEET